MKNSVAERSVISIICEDVDESEIQQIETITVTQSKGIQPVLSERKQVNENTNEKQDVTTEKRLSKEDRIPLSDITIVKSDFSDEEVSPEPKERMSFKLDGDERTQVDVPIADDDDDDDDAYDTDLEADENERKSYNSITAKDLYYKACEQLGVVPTSYFVQHMTDETVNLSHHCLGPNGAKALAAPLVVNTSVLELNLEDNWITADGMKDIADMLIENCYIANVNLAGNKLGRGGAKHLSAVIKENTNLRQLNLSRNDFSDNDAEYFADALKINLRLKNLNLSGNSFCEIGGGWLGQAIANNEAIENLNLSWNHLRRKGALAICAGLKVNITIKYLDLSWNGFSDDGAMAMGLALKTNNTLIWLDLSHNRISDRGATMLAKGLEINDTLKTLKIANNPIQSSGAMALIYSISKNINSAIEELDVIGVQINEDFLRESENLKDKCQEQNSGRAGFNIMVNPSDVSAFNRKKFARVMASPDPMDVIQKFLEDKRLRLIDLFRNFDKDLSWRISPAEFKKGILNAGVPLTKQQLKKLMRSLDLDKDGQVNYKEFFAGRKKALLRRREMLRKEAEEKSKKKNAGKKMWGAWENALHITSSTSSTRQATGSSTLRSRSMVIPGGKLTAGKANEESRKQTRKTTIIPITPRLIKSFVESSYSSKQGLNSDGISGILTKSTIISSTTSLEKLNFYDEGSKNFAELSIQVPIAEDLKCENEKQSILSIDSTSPRRTGGIANSRKRPPSN